MRIAEAAWAAVTPSWGAVSASDKPVFFRGEIRPLLRLALTRVVTHPVTTARLLASGQGLHGALGFLTWLDTASFFGVKHLRTLDGRPLPVERTLSRLNELGKTEPGSIGLGIIARNEEEFITRALSSAAPFVDEMVVVDGGSTDDTVNVARREGAQVVVSTHDISRPETFDESRQRNKAINELKTDWVIEIDADEWITPELGSLIRECAKLTSIDAVFAPRLNLYEGETEPYAWPNFLPVLFRRNLRYQRKHHAHLYGYTRVITFPMSGPYLMHSKSKLRAYKTYLSYEEYEGLGASAEAIQSIRDEIRRLEGESNAP